jgi:hypothetical protein
MGNAVHIVHNNVYDNAAGLVTDSFYAGGHPGFPQSGAVFEKNNIYSNNFDVYHYPKGYPESRKVESAVGVPLGTGLLIAGGNDDMVRGNHIWNNWRRGAMLLAVPDAISCPPGTQTCMPSNPTSTSFDNRFYDNRMGRAPSGAKKPNGVDFWWDEFPTDTGNCWYGNRGPDGTDASWTGDPQRFVTPGRSVPGFLPEDCGTSVGTGNSAKEAMLAYCAEAAIGDTTCDWYSRPPRPGTAAAARYEGRQARVSRLIIASERLTSPACGVVGSTISCASYADRP